MKTLFTFVLTFAVTSGFAQQDMFWNNYSHFNPAMSGFEYKQHGALSYSDYFRNKTEDNLVFNYNTRIKNKHGVGLNYSQEFEIINSSNLLANYNYQFDLKESGKLSAGIGAGFNRRIENTKYFSPNRTTPPDSYFNIQLSAGLAHKWKGLVSGISVHNTTRYGEDLNPYTAKFSPYFVAHVGYGFQLGNNIQLTPRAIFQIQDNSLSIYSNIELKLFNKFSVGVLHTFDQKDQLGFHAGYHLADKIHLGYAYNSVLKHHKIDYLERGKHTFTLGFTLK